MLFLIFSPSLSLSISVIILLITLLFLTHLSLSLSYLHLIYHIRHARSSSLLLSSLLSVSHFSWLPSLIVPSLSSFIHTFPVSFLNLLHPLVLPSNTHPLYLHYLKHFHSYFTYISPLYTYLLILNIPNPRSLASYTVYLLILSSITSSLFIFLYFPLSPSCFSPLSSPLHFPRTLTPRSIPLIPSLLAFLSLSSSPAATAPADKSHLGPCNVLQ